MLKDEGTEIHDKELRKDLVDCMKLVYVNCRVQPKDDVIIVVRSTT